MHIASCFHYPTSTLRAARVLTSRCSSISGNDNGAQTQDPTYPNFSWEVLHTRSDGSNKSRLGLLVTPHGQVLTPAFIFCATKAAIKGLTAEMMKDAGTQIILSNTYHLLLQPGSEVVQTLGGLQKLTGWNGPMLTDSGGYQIFSMGFGSVSNEIKGRRNAEQNSWNSTLLSINETGAVFRSYVDGSHKFLTPELSIKTQRELGADLIVVLDECTPFNVDKEYTAQSMRRSHRWAVRSLQEFMRGDDGSQALYGIIQGGVYSDLRNESVDFANSQPFFGIAIGGSLGDKKGTMHDIVRNTAGRIRGDRPIHLLGIGGVRDIFNGVRNGIDTFDCVHPTRLGRHGGALVMAHHWEDEVYQTGASATKSIREHISLVKSRFRTDSRPIDDTCGCYTCKNFSRGYLRHLLKAQETLGGTLVSLHNVFFMNRLMADIREGILTNTLDSVEARFVHPALKMDI